MSTPSILLVEQDSYLAEGLVAFLQSNGYAVDHVRNGRAALKTAAEQPPDLILSCHFMQPVNGIALLQSIRSDPQTASTPFILMSTSASIRHKRESVKHGVDGYFFKPFDAMELLSCINKLLREKQTNG